MNKERLWTKDFITIAAINFFIALVFYLLMVTIAPYAIDKFQASTSVAGFVSGIFILGALSGRIVAGRIVEELGRKKLLIVSLVFFFVTTTFYFGAINFPLLVITRLLHGFAFGAVTTVTGTIIAHIIPNHRRGEGIGYFSMSAILATALGPFVGIFLSQHADYNIIFIFTSLLSAICLVIAFMFREPAANVPVQPQAKSFKNFQISNFLEFSVIPISIVVLFISFSYSGVLTFMSFYTKQINLAEASRLFFLVYAISVFVSRPFSGKLFDAKGANIVVYPSLLIYAISMLVFSQVNQGITLLIAGSLMGLGYGNFTLSALAISLKLAPRHRLGLATSTFYVFFDIGFAIGPYIFGFLIPYTGCRGLYLSMVAVILVAIVFYYFLLGRKVTLQSTIQ